MVFGWKLAEGLPILQNRSCTNSHYRACGKILELPKCRRRQQLVGCTSWRGKPNFFLRREGVSSLAAQQERARSQQCWLDSSRALQGVPAGGGREARARLPSFREIFLGEGHFPDMSHGLRCARMRIAWNHSKFDARDTSPGTRVSQNFLSDFFSGCNAYAQERQSWVMAGQTL